MRQYNRKNWYNIPVNERMGLLKEYKKKGYSYRDAVDDFETFLKQYEEGGVIEEPIVQRPVNNLLQNNIQFNQPQTQRNSTYVPQQFQERQNIQNIQQDKLNLTQRYLKGDTSADTEMNEKYGTSVHRFRYENDPIYAQKVDETSKKLIKEYGSINYSNTDLRRGDNTPPVLQFMYPQLQGKTQRAMSEFSSDVIGSALPIPGLEAMGKIPSVFKAGKNLVKGSSKADNIAKIINKTEVLKSNFKSEIDWGKWNKEISENKVLMQDYNPYTFMERNFNPPIDESGNKIKFSVPSKFKNNETYRVMTSKDANELLNTGKFKKSLPITQQEQYLDNLKKTDIKKYKAIKYAENSRNYTRVTPYKDYAEMHYFDDINNPLDKGVIVTIKPLKNRLKPSTELGGYEELFAKDLSLDDVLNIKDRDGKILYESAIGNNGMFDMNNPNIYKGLVVPIVGGTLLKKSRKNKKEVPEF